MRLSRVRVSLGSLLLTLSRYFDKRSSSSGALSLDELSNSFVESLEDSSSISGTTCAGSLTVLVRYLLKRKSEIYKGFFFVLLSNWKEKVGEGMGKRAQ